MSRGDLAQIEREYQRITILRALVDVASGRANEGVLQATLKFYGLMVTRDQLSQQTAWLEEQGLVNVESLSDGDIRIVTLLERGEDVAQGLITVPGVKRPRRR